MDRFEYQEASDEKTRICTVRNALAYSSSVLLPSFAIAVCQISGMRLSVALSTRAISFSIVFVLIEPLRCA